MKRLIFITFYLLMVVSANCQKNYAEAIKKGDSLLHIKQYDTALKKYFAAEAFDDSKKIEVKKKVSALFDSIQNLKNQADRDRDDAKRQKLRAENNLRNAIYSSADRLLLEAEEKATSDPTLALHIVDEALKGTKNIKDSFPLIAERADRIYYENNFASVIPVNSLDNDAPPLIKSAVLSRDSNHILAITEPDSVFVINLSGKIENKIELDASLKNYEFISNPEGRILIHGYNTFNTASGGQIWDIEKRIHKDLNQEKWPGNLGGEESVVLNVTVLPGDWARNVFVCGYNAFMVNNDGVLIPVITSKSNLITGLSFAPNGKYIACSYTVNKINILNSLGALVYKVPNAGGPVSNMKFSDDGSRLFFKAGNTLQYATLSDNVADANKQIPTSYLPIERAFQINGFDISPESDTLLVNSTLGLLQEVFIYIKRDNHFERYSRFISPVIGSTSATFSRNRSMVLTSSDKIRHWKIPVQKSEPDTVFVSNEVANDGITKLNIIYLSQGKYKTDTIEKWSPRLNVSANNLYSPFSSLVIYLSNNKVLIYGDDKKAKLYHEKQSLDSFINGFKFEAFTEEQKKRYSLPKYE